MSALSHLLELASLTRVSSSRRGPLPAKQARKGIFLKGRRGLRDGQRRRPKAGGDVLFATGHGAAAAWARQHRWEGAAVVLEQSLCRWHYSPAYREFQ